MILARRTKKGGNTKIQNRQVLLKMLPVNWLFTPNYDGSKSGRKSLVTALANAPHESLFSTELIITLVESFWASYSAQMIWFAFIPFIVYLCVTEVYFINYIATEPKPYDTSTPETWVIIVFYLLWFYFTSHEFIQFYCDRIDYMLDLTNYFDIASSLLNIYLVTNH